MVAVLCSVCLYWGIQSGIPPLGARFTQASTLLKTLASKAGFVDLALVQSSVPALCFTSQPPGTVRVALEDRLMRLSEHELAAGLALEVAHLQLFKSRGQRALSPTALPLDLAKGAFETMGPWNKSVRREAIKLANRYLDELGEPPVALLTLLECESVGLGPLGRDVFEGWTGISMQELINEAKAVLTQKGVRIRRSEVSLAYRVEEVHEAGGVASRIFDQELFAISEAEAVTYPHLLRALNTFFDRGPQMFDIRSANASLFLGSDQVVTLSGPVGESRAGAAKLAIAKALFEYSRCRADFGSCRTMGYGLPFGKATGLAEAIWQ